MLGIPANSLERSREAFMKKKPFFLGMGEVLAPRASCLPYGFISLREAIVNAGGIPFTGDLNHILVIRNHSIYTCRSSNSSSST